MSIKASQFRVDKSHFIIPIYKLCVVLRKLERKLTLIKPYGRKTGNRKIYSGTNS